MTLDIDTLLQDNERRAFIESAANVALVRTPDASKRTGQLFIALLRGEVKTDSSSPVDYL